MSAKIKNIVTVILIGIVFLGGFIWSVLKPDELVSLSERRQLASMPKINKQDIMSGKFMSDFEEYSLDQFPMRDELRTLKSISAYSLFRQKDNNGIYIYDGFASKIEYPLNYDSLEYAGKRMRNIYDKYLEGKNMNIYFSVIPDKNYFMAEQNGYLSLDYDELISVMRENTDYMQYIDITNLLELSDYYFTDTHWRQEKIIDVAKHIASEMGVELSENYETKLFDDSFCGVYYGYSALPLPKENLYYLTNDTLEKCSVFNYETNSYIPVYDPENFYGDSYEIFLSGSLPLLTIENHNADTDKELIIFRDSFGSSLAPLLVEGYSKITLVDIRYISGNVLGSMIDFDNQDILFLYSTLILNNSITMK